MDNYGALKLKYKVIGFKSPTITFDVALGIIILSIIKKKKKSMYINHFESFEKYLKIDLFCNALTYPNPRIFTIIVMCYKRRRKIYKMKMSIYQFYNNKFYES